MSHSGSVRCEKSGKDAAEWLPARNRCWFAARVLEVRRAYGLTIDRREAAALDRILAAGKSTALEPVVWAVPSASASVPDAGPAAGDDGRDVPRRRKPDSSRQWTSQYRSDSACGDEPAQTREDEDQLQEEETSSGLER